MLVVLKMDGTLSETIFFEVRKLLWLEVNDNITNRTYYDY